MIFFFKFFFPYEKRYSILYVSREESYKTNFLMREILYLPRRAQMIT